MGQQQLLLLVLGVVLVGLAVALGMRMFSDISEQSAYDAMANEAVTVAAKAFAWRASPRAMAGGQNAPYLNGLTAEALGYKRYESDTPLDFHDSDAYRWIRGENSERPYVQIMSKTYPGLMVQSHLYGPDEACMTFRTIRREDGVWTPDANEPPLGVLPDGCSGW